MRASRGTCAQVKVRRDDTDTNYREMDVMAFLVHMDTHVDENPCVAIRSRCPVDPEEVGQFHRGCRGCIHFPGMTLINCEIDVSSRVGNASAVLHLLAQNLGAASRLHILLQDFTTNQFPVGRANMTIGLAPPASVGVEHVGEKHRNPHLQMEQV